MAKKSIASCCACGKLGHSAQIGPLPWKPYICPLSKDPRHWGKLGARLDTGRCSECGWSNFRQNEYSREGIRGYRCMNPACGTIKPERTEGTES